MKFIFLMFLTMACERGYLMYEVHLTDGNMIYCEGQGTCNFYNCNTGFDYPKSAVSRSRLIRAACSISGDECVK